MAKRENELFIGKEFIGEEGRTIKHPALINVYASLNVNKISKTPIDIIGIDIETDHTTGDIRLLGFCYDDKYAYYTKNHLSWFHSWVKYAASESKSLAYWKRLDPYVIFRTMLENVPEVEHRKALGRFGKISGVWDRNAHDWTIQPVISFDMPDGSQFGIIQAIRSTVQFFIKRASQEDIDTVWAFDIAQLYKGHLAKEAKRYDWYSKVAKEAHLVDWKRFGTEASYQKIVLKSNYLDAKACTYLANQIQDDFYTAFGYYPKTLISAGALARSAIVATIRHSLSASYSNEKELGKAVHQEVSTIGIMGFYDEWAKKFGEDVLKDMYCLFTEAYSGGYIESVRYGYSKKGCHADIASAYPAFIRNLLDLRGSKIVKGSGKPPRLKHGYVFIRGTVNVPHHVNYHPITIKHWLNKDTNVRCTGTYRASYILEEREYMEEHGCTFEDETWYAIECTGKKSVLANAAAKLLELRQTLLKEGKSAEYIVKAIVNSIYGIMFEAVDTHTEKTITRRITAPSDRLYKNTLKEYLKAINLDSLFDQFDDLSIIQMWHSKDSNLDPETLKDELAYKGIYLESENPVDIMKELNSLYRLNIQAGHYEEYEEQVIERNGYRAGEFWNPLYASIITAKTRIMMARAASEIEKAGGKPIILMTDSVTWEGTPDMLPPSMVKSVKTTGYFETPDVVEDIVCLGTGRYGFTKKGKYVAKHRGLNISDADGDEITKFNWLELLKIMQRTNSTSLNVSVRTLISVGMVYHRPMTLSVNHLGRIIDEQRNVKAVVGKSKRMFDDRLDDPQLLATQLIETEPIYINPAMFGNWEVMDQTLPKLRFELMKRKVVTASEIAMKHTRKRVAKHYTKNKEEILENRRIMYKKLRYMGISSPDAKRMQNWSLPRLELYFKEKELEEIK